MCRVVSDAEKRQNNFKPRHKGSFSILVAEVKTHTVFQINIGIREDPGDEVEHFSESEQGLDSKRKPDMPDTMHRVRLVQRNRTLKLCYISSSNDTCNLDVVLY